MINLFLGAYGHGKSTKIIENIKADYEKGIRSFLIVPEQQTVIAERDIAKKLPPQAQLYTEATNFTRLANSVFRKTGGLKYNYITKSGQNLIMYRTICEARSLLKHFTIEPGHERNYVPMLLQAIGELKTYGVTPRELERAMNELDEKRNELKARLGDLILLWTEYDRVLNDSYDDPYDDLLLLDKKLGECEFFKDCNVYIDSFYGFTRSQFAVLTRIIDQAKEVTIALDCPPNAKEDEIQYAKIAGTKSMLLSKYKDKIEITPFETDYKHKEKPELEYICKNLWQFEAEPLIAEGQVKLALASDEFQECEYVCTQIMELIRSGEKYGSIAIIARNSSTYQGIIDFCLEKYHIPHYMSIPSRLTTKPVIKMVLSALNAIIGYRRDDIISYIKCGYTDIDSEELSLFENYMYRWNIYGSKFKNEDYWTANPDGFVTRPKAYQAENLIKIRETREKVAKSLDILEKAFTSTSTVKDCCNAVCDFLNAHKVREKLQDEIKKATDREDAQELSQVWEIFVLALEQIANICGGVSCNAETFIALLNYAMLDSKIGTIPTGEDNVIIADASLIRAKNIRHVFILGANEGVFPASVKDDSFFSDSDKIALETVSIPLSAKTDQRADDEHLFFSNSVAAASHSVTVTALKTGLNGEKKEPSIGFTRLNSLLYEIVDDKAMPITPVDISSIDTSDKIYSLDMAKELFGSSYPELKKAIKELYPEAKELSEADFANTKDEISENAAKELFGNEIWLYKSNMESFKKCPLGYYCNYILGLKDSEKIRFSSNDVGNLMHAIFEDFLKDPSSAEYTEKEIWDKVTEKADAFTKKVCGGFAVSNKMKHFFVRLKSTVYVFVQALLEENRASKFSNFGFELKISGDGKVSPPTTKFKINDTCSAVMTGDADRVDLLKAEDGNTYVKIFDYKSGTHTFNKDDVEEGFDLQMLIYLYALCNMEACTFRDKLMSFKGKKVGDKEATDTSATNEGKIEPAGIVYLSYKINDTKVDKEIDLNSKEAKDAEDNKLRSKIMRSGLELDNESLLSGDKRFRLPNGCLIDKDEFTRLFEIVESTVTSVGEGMLKGDACASPLTDRGACDFCKYGAICRRRIKSVRFN